MTQKHLSKVLDERLEENEKTAVSERTFMYDGVLYPTMICSLETLKSINTFRAREDDILLATYPKTGKHYSFTRNAFACMQPCLIISLEFITEFLSNKKVADSKALHI